MSAEATYDVLVIGGGASGLAAAIQAARHGARVVIVERDVACGLGLLATGNGRCNLSNTHLDPARYRDPEMARLVMGGEPERRVSELFDSLGLVMTDIEGRLYPVTRRAESVRDVLIGGIRRLGVEVLCGATVRSASLQANGGWELEVLCPERPLPLRVDRSGKLDVRRARKLLAAASQKPRMLRAGAVVLAPGGGSKALCELFGLPHHPEVPVLCPVACCLPEPLSGRLSALDGVRVEGALALVRHGEEVYREAGEVLFRPFGVSGIVAFDLSRRVEAGDVLELDLLPSFETGELMGLLRHREDVCGPFTGEDARWFDGLLARPVAQLVVDALAVLPSVPSDGLRGDLLTEVAKLCKHLPLEVAGRAEERQAQVRRGGLPLDAIDAATLEVKGGRLAKVGMMGVSDAFHDEARSRADRPAVDGLPAGSGLFACGEFLDQDADCGGFNLAWAWLSGLRAGSSAAAAALSAARRA